jgi:hypothetical protein
LVSADVATDTADLDQTIMATPMAMAAHMVPVSITGRQPIGAEAMAMRHTDTAGMAMRHGLRQGTQTSAEAVMVQALAGRVGMDPDGEAWYPERG